MPRDYQKVITGFSAAACFAVAVVAGLPSRAVKAAGTSNSVSESINIEGSVSNSTINNTVNHENPATLALLAKALNDKDASEEHRRQAEAKAAELAAKLGFTSAAVVEFFRILGEQNVPEEKVPARLIEVATHFAQTRDELAALEPGNPHAAELARSAKEALDSGRLTEADALLDQAKEDELAALQRARELKQKAQEAEDRHALNAAKLLAGRGNIALAQLHYKDAARHFGEALELVPKERTDVRASFLWWQADALEREGDVHGDNQALRRAIECYGQLLALEARDQSPLQWASIQDAMGNALETLGKREWDTVRLKDAITAYHAALEERTRKRAPLDWASTENNLGNALLNLAEREGGTNHLEEAVAAYRAALKVWTPERVGWG